MLVSACSTTSPPPQPPQIITEYKREKVICPSAPYVKPLEFKSFVWIVATDDEGVKVMGIHESEYKKLSANMSAIKAFVESTPLVAQYYKNCIEDHNAKAE